MPLTIHPPPHLAAALASARPAYEVEPGIWQPRGAGGAGGGAQYDTIGAAYDLVGGLDIYHRVFWGVSTHEYRAFAERAVTACGDGTLLDAGCGSMLFTAGAHQANERGAVIGTDASVRMLRLARARVESYRDSRRVALLHSDVLRSPFRTGAFEVVICLHVAHVLADLEGLLGEVQRILKPGGTFFLTSLVLVDRWRDRYLRALSRRGVVSSPRRQDAILAAVRARFGTEPDSRMAGNMLFAEVTHAPGRTATPHPRSDHAAVRSPPGRRPKTAPLNEREHLGHHLTSK